MYSTDFKLPQMLTINQAAKESNMSYSSIRQLCLDRKIQFIRIGSPSSRGKYLINRNSLNDFLNGNSNRDTTSLPEIS